MIPKATNRLIDKELKKAKHASMIVGVVTRNGMAVESYLHDYYQDVDPENLLLEIGSTTKTFTTTLLAKLVTDHIIHLDDSVIPYVPEYKQALTYQSKEVTFRHLATHTASLPKDDMKTIRTQIKRDPTLKVNPFQQYGKEALHEFFTTYQPSRAIGSKWTYSNLGIALLGVVLERVLEMSYEESIQSYVLEPLGMKNTFFHVPDSEMHRYVKAYTKKGEQIPPLDIPAMRAAGGLKSTLKEMLAYLRFQMGLRETTLGASISLTHEGQQIKAMKGFEQAIGWMKDQPKWSRYPIIQHPGNTIGFHTYCGFIKELEIGVVAISTIQLNISRMIKMLLQHDGLINTNIAYSIFQHHIRQKK